MTEAIYMEDCYAKEMDATVKESGDGWVVLDRTVFYPTGGGQDNDTGIIEADGEEFRVVDVRKDHGEIKHFIEGNAVIPEGTEVHGEIDWGRRHKNMRMHTAQHLVSAVVLELFDATTVGNQIYPDRSRIDFSPVDFSDEDLRRIEERVNELVSEELPVSIYELPREEAVERTPHQRANLDLLPDSIKKLRMIEIGDYDVCPCGGTHVKNIGELGKVDITAVENKGAGTQRIEYVLRDV